MLFRSHNGVNGPYESAWTIDGRFVADWISAGTLNANLVKIINLIAERLYSQNGLSELDVSGAIINFRNSGKQTISIQNYRGGGAVFINEYDDDGNLSSLAAFSGRSIYFQGNGGSPGSQLGIGIGSSGLPWLNLPGENPKDISWKDNGDGTYTLIGS